MFVIYGTEGKKVSVEIFNRWGNKVYENSNYQNNWDGTSNTNFVLYGEKISDGTYYYVITIEGEKKTRTGYLTLWR